MTNISPDQIDKDTGRQMPPGENLPDSPWDEERMKPEEVILDLPDVKDIPGQGHIHVPPLGELADTTISSDDEEGVGLFEDDAEEDVDAIQGAP